MVSIQQAATSVTQSARAQWDNFSCRDEPSLSSRGFRDSLDSLLRTMFAPCTGQIGGVPRDEVLDTGRSSKSRQVSASSSHSDRASPNPFQRQSLSKLRQLGAQHQLSLGVHGDTLAAMARPCSPEKGTPDLVDFDDGISAISSHTLEEMERRRIQSGNVITVLREKLHTPIIEDVEWREKQTEFTPFSDEENPFPKMEMSRMESSSTRKTNATEESFQKFMQQEAKYWEEEVKDSTRGRPSLEERASRLRALSRSRSRSDGSSNKSKSSLLSSGHPHDTVPVFSSDLFRKTKSTRSSPSTSKKVVNSFDNDDPFVALDYGEI